MSVVGDPWARYKPWIDRSHNVGFSSELPIFLITFPSVKPKTHWVLFARDYDEINARGKFNLVCPPPPSLSLSLSASLTPSIYLSRFVSLHCVSQRTNSRCVFRVGDLCSCCTSCRFSTKKTSVASWHHFREQVATMFLLCVVWKAILFSSLSIAFFCVYEGFQIISSIKKWEKN